MNNILVITEPDDVLEDGFRILLVDLTTEQTEILSDSLTNLESIPTTMTYVWRNEDPINWLFDKKAKSHLIVFNTLSTNQKLVGYLAAQGNSYYFGSLQSIRVVNPNELYNQDDCSTILNNYITNYRKSIN